MGQKNKKKRTSQNKEFLVITYLFLGLFLCMIAYYVYFQVVRSEEFINSPYNSLQDLFSNRVVRGEIISSDGYVLAQTTIDEDGTETREYPYGNVFSHAVGYSINGKAGLENQANFSLLRSHAFFLEQFANDLSGEKNIGDNVITTLNYKVQTTAYYALGNYDGAVIVMEPQTGKILAMVSKPSFNPNTIAQDWEWIHANENSAILFNRATQGQYAPGSVFKIFTMLEYYQENPDTYATYEYQCNGSFTHEGQTIHCAGNKSHGGQDLRLSFANSCNSSFAELSLSLEQDRFYKLCNSLLFNHNLPIAFESGVSSFTISDNDSSSLIMETGIGQGKTLVSPLHMALITSAIANEGVMMTPYLIDHTENYEGIIVDSNKPKEYKTLFTKDEADFLQEYMKAVVEEGTASRLNNQSYTAYGKTGTAQVSDITDQTNAWFVGYAQKEGYLDIAVAVVIEDSGYGSTYAIPIAEKIFDAYYN